MTRTPIYRYSNSGEPLGMVPYWSAYHEEDLDGKDVLTLTCGFMPSKRDRMVWRDGSGEWHEHMVDSVESDHPAGGTTSTVTCSNSINELYGVIMSEGKIKGTVHELLAKLLKGTRWTAGECYGEGVRKLEVHHKSARECISDLCELVDGELVTEIAVGDGVTSRTVKIVGSRGGKTAGLAFTYGRNMTDVKREMAAEEVFTGVVCYGEKVAAMRLAKEEESAEEELEQLRKVDTSGMTDDEKAEHRRQVNAAQKSLNAIRGSLSKVRSDQYAKRMCVRVRSELSLQKWGVPVAGGKFAHNWKVYTDASCTDREFLREQGAKLLASVSTPPVRYEFNASTVKGWHDVYVGDLVLCTDDEFPELGEVARRVSYVRRDLAGGAECTVAVGRRHDPALEQYKASEKAVRQVTGNDSRVTSSTPRSASYSRQSDYDYGGYDGGYDGGSSIAAGDGWTHQIDGVTVDHGTVNFVTTGGSSWIEPAVEAAQWGADAASKMISFVRDAVWGGDGE